MLRILDFRLDISAVDFVAIEEQLVSELQYLQVHPMNQTVADLAGKAAVELANAHIDPIPLEPLQGCDEQEDTIELFCKSSEQRRPSKPGIELQTSPATSACTDEGSKLSRNSSMNSVVEDSELHSSCKSAKKSPCRKDAQREHITHSPTTPGDDYRQCRTVSTVC